MGLYRVDSKHGDKSLAFSFCNNGIKYCSITKAIYLMVLNFADT